MTIQVGDRVRCIVPAAACELNHDGYGGWLYDYGDVGIVYHISERGCGDLPVDMLVDWQNDGPLRSQSGCTRGWYIYENEVELVNSPERLALEDAIKELTA